MEKTIRQRVGEAAWELFGVGARLAITGLEAQLAESDAAGRQAQEESTKLLERVRELESKVQREPLESETVCHACNGSGWVESGY